jgi:RND family efflux transporter MFP subunit
MKARLWIPLAGVAVLGLVAWGVLAERSSRREAGVQAEAVAVIVAAPRTGPVERTLLYSGSLVPKSTVTLTARVPGKIERILVEEGQLVTRDQPLLLVEDDAVRLQMQQAHAAWQAAQAQYEKARRGVRTEELENARALYETAREDLQTAEESFRRSEKLFASGAIAKAQYEEAESALRSAKTELENAGRTVKMLEEGASPEEQEMARAQAQAARASYDLARLQVDYTELRAPEAGTVARILQDEGNTVGGAVPILVLVQDDPIVAEVAVPERHYGELVSHKDRIECRVRPAAYPESESYIGSIGSVAPTISPGSRTFGVSVEIPNPRGLLRPGMYVEVELVMERRERALLVPESAVLERDGRSVVFVAQESSDGTDAQGLRGVAEERTVAAGLRQRGSVEILDGISARERVIVEGNVFLEDAQPVLIVESR